MATPASRATSVMVGPECRRLAGFRGDGTNVPSYSMTLTIGQTALSEQERITGLSRLNTRSRVNETYTGAEIYTRARLRRLPLTLSVHQRLHGVRFGDIAVYSCRETALCGEYGQTSPLVPSKRGESACASEACFPEYCLLHPRASQPGCMARGFLLQRLPWDGTVGTLTERRLARSR